MMPDFANESALISWAAALEEPDIRRELQAANVNAEGSEPTARLRLLRYAMRSHFGIQDLWGPDDEVRGGAEDPADGEPAATGLPEVRQSVDEPAREEAREMRRSLLKTPSERGAREELSTRSVYVLPEGPLATRAAGPGGRYVLLDLSGEAAPPLSEGMMRSDPAITRWGSGRIQAETQPRRRSEEERRHSGESRDLTTEKQQHAVAEQATKENQEQKELTGKPGSQGRGGGNGKQKPNGRWSRKQRQAANGGQRPRKQRPYRGRGGQNRRPNARNVPPAAATEGADRALRVMMEAILDRF
ncbi:uncharacterized protein LOC107274165 [Cephus cinctus]|uniref:Uncharacterized protein LOC107274165 n=1 Tax=Cephus cinctus TaxID=211228 RepID=A0AAJ7CDX0_CEPCN|nr:uncharacterized protein LOC107274165 [Cephus cinctus]